MRYAVLFDEKSKSQYSDAFFIPPGSVGVLSAFGLGIMAVLQDSQSKNARQKAIIQKLAFSGGEICSCSCACDDDAPLDFKPDFLYAEDVTQCGLWYLDACQNTGIIALPGTYRLFVNDETAPGNIFINIVRYAISEFGYIPKSLVFGE